MKIKKYFQENKKKFLMMALFLALAFSASQVQAQSSSPGGAPRPPGSATQSGVGGALNSAKEAVSGWSGNMTAGSMIEIVSFIINLLFQIVGQAYAVAMWLLDKLMDPGIYVDLLNSSAVNAGWTLVRDFVNLFFVIILLFVAISTILRIESYSAKKMLVNVLIAAMLVNFSKPISMVIIDASQLAMTFMLDNLRGQGNSYTSEISNLVGVQDVLRVDQNAPGMQNLASAATIMSGQIFGIIFMIIMMAMFVVLALGLLLRIVAFIVLIILSPLAFAAAPLRGTQFHAMFQNWITKMGSWAFFGPALLFFMWLAIVVLRESGVSSLTAAILPSSNPSSLNQVNGAGVFQGILGRVIPFAVAIYFLFYGYDVSKKMASKAGDSLSGLMNGAQGWISWAGRAAGLGGAIAGTAAAVPLGYKYLERAGGGQGPASAVTGAKNALGNTWQRTKQAALDGYEQSGQPRAQGREAGMDILRDQGYEVKKKWKDDGNKPAVTDLQNMLQSGKKEEKIAAALQLAEDGNLSYNWGTKVNQYSQALNAAGGDEKLKSELSRLAASRNLASLVEHEVQQGWHGANRATAYDTFLKGKTYQDITRQSNDLFDDNNEQFHTYVVNRAKAEGMAQAELAKVAQENMDATGLARWKRNILSRLN